MSKDDEGNTTPVESDRAVAAADATTPDPATHEPEKLSFFQVAGSTIAAALGVQSSKNRERDFAKGKVHHFIIAGIVFTVLFVLAVVTVVNLVLP